MLNQLLPLHTVDIGWPTSGPDHSEYICEGSCAALFFPEAAAADEFTTKSS